MALGDAPLPLSPDAAAGPSLGDYRAAQGSMQSVTLRVPRPPIQPIVKPVIEVEVSVEPLTFDEEVVLEPPPSLGEGDSEGEGPGVETGEGLGDGGESTEGLFRQLPPHPQGVFLPPPYDRGFEARLKVWVWVNRAGRVVPDSTRLDPPTDDSGFNRRMIEEASTWVFVPAQRDGVPVAVWFSYTISIGG